MLSLGRAADGAFTADYGTNARLLAHAGLHSNFVANVDLASTTAKRRRALESGRLLQPAADSGEAIRNPVTCVNTGAVVLFDVDAEEGRYPVYVKNSILNTNQDFDRAPFDELATLVENGVQVPLGLLSSQRRAFMFSQIPKMPASSLSSLSRLLQRPARTQMQIYRA